MNARRAVRSLSIIGFVVHLVFWLLFGPFTNLLEDRGWMQAINDPGLLFDPDLFVGFFVMGTLFCIYLPTAFSTLIVGLVCRWRKVREPRLWQALGPALGFFTIAYVLLWLWSFRT